MVLQSCQDVSLKLKNVTVSYSKHSLCSHGNKLISDICPL